MSEARAGRLLMITPGGSEPDWWSNLAAGPEQAAGVVTLGGPDHGAIATPRITLRTTAAFEQTLSDREATAGYDGAVIELSSPPDDRQLTCVESMMRLDPSIHCAVCVDPRDLEQVHGRLARFARWIPMLSPVGTPVATQTMRWLIACTGASRDNLRRVGELRELLRARGEALESEVSERRIVEQQLSRMAFRDPLTGLPNRAHLLDRLRQCFGRRRRGAKDHFAILFIDLDNFKLVNDSLGHDAGDELLSMVAKRLCTGLRSLDLLSQVSDDSAIRLGGDEFVILLEQLGRPGDATVVAERILELLSRPFSVNGRQITATLSIGIAVSSSKHERPEDILRDADSAMYRAKQSGKGRYALFDEALHEAAMARLKRENDLRIAVDEHQFRLVYEPIMSVVTGQVLAVEALLRWDHPELGLVPPDEFIDVAEDIGLTVPLGAWVLDQALAHLKEWKHAVPSAEELRLSVNLSRRQLLEPGIADHVAETLRRHDVDASRLWIEVTESAVMHASDAFVAALTRIRSLGVSVALDDFGTGLSSLACLHELPLDAIKIDRRFILDMQSNKNYAAVVDAILTLAKHLDLQVVAEGVESSAHLAALIALDCPFVQGFHITRSMEPEQVARFLDSRSASDEAA